MMRTTTKEKKYGGAHKACAVIDRWPISRMMVGKNTGMLLNATLQLKNMNCFFLVGVYLP